GARRGVRADRPTARGEGRGPLGRVHQATAHHGELGCPARRRRDEPAGVLPAARRTAPRAMTDDRRFFGHPRGLATLFFTEMWERFSYYGIRPLLVLFMTAALARGGFGFSRPTASAIVGIYAASVYLASLPGGWIADRWLGLRRSIWYGGLLIA